MFCSNCGAKCNEGEMFCRNCGVKLNNVLENPQNTNVQNNSKPIDGNKWAILSIVIPVAAIVWYWFIGLSFYLAIFIAGFGFVCANRGKDANKQLTTIGKVLNVILIVLSIIMLIFQIISIWAK